MEPGIAYNGQALILLRIGFGGIMASRPMRPTLPVIDCNSYSTWKWIPLRNAYSTHLFYRQHATTYLVACPLVVPTLSTWIIGLHSCVLNRHASPDPPLDHSTSVQPAHLAPPDAQATSIRSLASSLLFTDFVTVRIHQAQVLAGRAHRHVLAFEFALLSPTAFAQKKHPRAVDSPMTKVAVAGKVERARSQGVGEVVADVC